MKKYILLYALFAVVCAFSAAGAVSLLKVSSVDVARQDGRLRIDMEFDTQSIRPGRDREVVFTPVIRSIGTADSIELAQVRICGRNRYYSHLRNDDLEPGERIYEAGRGDGVEYHAAVDFEPWMERCTIDMREEVANCCDPAIPTADSPVAELNYVPEPFVPEFRFVALTGDSIVERTAEGKAFIDFVVNRTEIKPDYRGNRKEIASIIESIDFVKNDPDATITRITIKGFASPEGSYSNNVRLAMGRTASLKEYVREHYNFPSEIMWTDYEPEDWEGFRARMLESDYPHRDEIIAMIDSDMEPDAKDAAIRRKYPQEYKHILENIYPALRHSDYTVKYAIRTFVDIDELKAVFATDPGKLRPVDFQRIAATYPQGSPEYCATYLKAAEIYPHDAQAALNVANIMMAEGKLDSAAEYLHRAGDTPEAVYSRGVLAALKGDMERASALMGQASAAGLDIATSEKARLDAQRNRPTVKYFVGK